MWYDFGTDLLKPNDVNIQWGDSDLAIVGDKKVSIRATSGIPKVKTEILDNPLPTPPVKPKVTRAPRRTNVNVYATQSSVIEPGMGQNVAIKY